ncbi:MAG: AraC family transcriptional regulator [Syntrophomonadaceae bacterium]|jgi:AraC-like DNA-binding protein|nr:AraC family transcriptional regulator [Syntrophomonadaceae bacterium]
MKVRERGVLPESNIYFYTPREEDLKLFLVATSCGHYFCDDKYQVIRDNYESFLLFFVKHGRGFVYVNDRKITLAENEMFLLDCYHHHSYGTYSGSSMEILWVHFEGYMARNYFKAIVGRSNCSILRSRNPQSIFNNIYLIYEQFHKKSQSSGLFSCSVQTVHDRKYYLANARGAGVNGCPSVALNNKYIVNILTEFFLDNSTVLQRKDIIREELLAYISDNLDKSLNVEELAAKVALSPDYFTRRFRKETGYTPHQYVLLSRINAAKHFLKSGDLTVKEVAFSCGFSSESGFCISFKHIMGMSPTDYRESLVVGNGL